MRRLLSLYPVVALFGCGKQHNRQALDTPPPVPDDVAHALDEFNAASVFAQGKVTPVVLLCTSGPTGSDTSAAPCKDVLEDYFHDFPDARISGLNVLEAQEVAEIRDHHPELHGNLRPDSPPRGTAELVIWTNEGSQWPLAKDLSVSEVACDIRKTGPDCLPTLQKISNSGSSHVFVAPLLSGTVDNLASWSVIDVTTRAPSEVAWNQADIAAVPCTVNKGDYLLGEGPITSVRPVLREPLPSTGTGAQWCGDALVRYLHAHLYSHLITVVAEDGFVVDADLHTRRTETTRLLVLTDNSAVSQRPFVRMLSVSSVACGWFRPWCEDMQWIGSGKLVPDVSINSKYDPRWMFLIPIADDQSVGFIHRPSTDGSYVISLYPPAAQR